jgi:hypothetical protein
MSNSNSFGGHNPDTGTEREALIWRWFGGDTRWQR